MFGRRETRRRGRKSIIAVDEEGSRKEQEVRRKGKEKKEKGDHSLEK